MTDELTHVGADGAAQMVDVTAKEPTDRIARASGEIRMRRETLDLIRENALAKGDVLSVARLAGIMAAKRAAELIPLCHGIPLTDVKMVITPDESIPGLRIEATARTVARTGVEMEAMTAVAIALVTVFDMAKSVDRDMQIGAIRLEEKSGGRSGHWTR